MHTHSVEPSYFTEVTDPTFNQIIKMVHVTTVEFWAL